MRMRVAMVGVLVLLGSGPAGATVPLGPDPLERGQAVAEPAVYRLEVTASITALRHNGGLLRLESAARRVTTAGTAFGIAEGGWLAAADHVANGEGEAAAIRAYQQHLVETQQPASWDVARSWVALNAAEPRGVKVLARRVSQSGTDQSWTPRIVGRRPGTDLALLRIDAPGAPALDLLDELTVGTDVTAIAYPGGDTLDANPVAREGQLGRTGTASTTDPPGALRTLVRAPIVRGDSGAPVVDVDGRVRGMVVALSGEGGGTIEPAARLRELLGENAVAGEGPVTGLWREALSRLWSLDFTAAEAAFGDVVRASPDHGAAVAEQARAMRLASTAVAGARLEGVDVWYRRLIALALASAVGAVAAAFGLIWIEARRRPITASEEFEVS